MTIENPFNKKHQAQKSEAENGRLHSKFTPKSYFERNAKTAYACMAMSFMAGLVSIVTGYAYIEDTLVYIPLAIGVSLVIDVAKHYAIGKVFETYFPDNTLDVGPVVFAVALFGVSIFTAYKGGNQLPHFLSKVNGGPALASIDSIKDVYQSRIDAAAASAATFHESRKWRNRLSARDGKEYANQTKATQNLHAERDAAIEKAKADNKATIDQNNSQNAVRGANTALISVVADLFIIFCVWFVEYRDWRGYCERQENGSPSPTPSATTTVYKANPPDTVTNGEQVSAKNAQTLVNTGVHDNRDTETIIVYGKKQCINCHNWFESNAKKHKYCSDPCRYAYNKTNNSKLYAQA